MKGMNPIVLVLAVIGGLIVLGVVLKVAFKLIGFALLIGAGLVIWYFVQGAMGKKP
ncbi:MAG: hypothetical protein V4459_03545 [Pseudomonadota bacterium]